MNELLEITTSGEADTIENEIAAIFEVKNAHGPAGLEIGEVIGDVLSIEPSLGYELRGDLFQVYCRIAVGRVSMKSRRNSHANVHAIGHDAIFVGFGHRDSPGEF
ncbi:hypothetical protein AE923_03010 [Xanthomonas arboricola]|nr:hypothetical protein AE923_03010 [Xanthomonas arboricola]